MKYFFFLIITFNFLFNYTVYSAESYIVYKVNNKIITNIDIENEYRYLIALNENLKVQVFNWPFFLLKQVLQWFACQPEVTTRHWVLRGWNSNCAAFFDWLWDWLQSW